MVATKISNFGGMIPLQDDTLLPETGASWSENTWLYSGNLTGIRAPTQLRSNSSSAITKVYRIPQGATDKSAIASSWWLEFENANTTVVESPVADDSYKRRYWAPSVDGPMYNTQTRIAAGNSGANAPYKLGIPAPSVAPSLIVTGGAAPLTTRSYVYTWVSLYGEEGPPSPPVTVTGNVSGSWDLTLTAPGAGETTQRSLDQVRIYRTVTSSQGIATYFFVAQQTIADTTYSDTISDAVVSGNAQLASQYYTAPPSDLEGLIAMPNGIIAGWVNNEIWFSEPYRPHAWPGTYAINVDSNVVGCGVIGQSLIICTETGAYACTGVRPSVMSLSKIAGSEPCLSQGSIVSAPEGVYYASQNGLMLVVLGGAENITRNLIKTDEWNALFKVPGMRSARLGTAYYAFSTIAQGAFDTGGFYTGAFEWGNQTGSSNGLLIDTGTPRIGLNLMSSSKATTNVYNDVWTGEVFLVRDGKTYIVDLAGTTRDAFKWKSKLLQPTDMRNFEAMKVYFSVPAGTPTLNPVPNASLVQSLAADQYGLVRLYADGRHVWTRELRTSGELLRLPSGFKADQWQIEIEARIEIQSVQIATSARDLRGV